MPSGIDRAHNEYVELAVELGLPAMLLFLVWLFKGIVPDTARNIRKKKRHQSRPRGWTRMTWWRSGRSALLPAFCCTPGVDFVWRLPANVIYAVIILALLNAAMLMVKLNDDHEDTVRVH
jgi:hypothetical protein